MAKNENTVETVTLPAPAPGNVLIEVLEEIVIYPGSGAGPWSMFPASWDIPTRNGMLNYGGTQVSNDAAAGDKVDKETGLVIPKIDRILDRQARIDRSDYFGSASGPSADWKTKYLREAVVGVVMANMKAEYKGKLTEAKVAVAKDLEGMFMRCCEIRHDKFENDSNTAALEQFPTPQSQFDALWPKQVAHAEKRVEQKREADKANANAFDLGDFAPE